MNPNLTLASSCEYQIKALILSGELRPGARIKGEFLKNYLGVGLSPIREALSRLATTPLVTAIDNVGFKVSSLDAEKVCDVYRGYAKLEALLLREAIENGGDEWEAGIMAALYRLAKVEGEGLKVEFSTWSLRNDEFHNALIHAGTLVCLQQVRQQFLLQKDWFHSLAYQDMCERIIEVNHAEHQQIAELVIARKANAACVILYKHTMHSLDSLLLTLQRGNYLNLAE